MRRRTAGIYVALALSATIALMGAGKASAAPLPGAGDANDPACFGPPAAFVAQFDHIDGVADGAVRYGERRVFIENQGWAQAGTVDLIDNVAQAASAHHFHSGTCFPLNQTWDEASGTIRLDFMLQAHNVNPDPGFIGHITALGFLDNGSRTVSLNWNPSAADETRFVSATRATSSLTRCGRVESRMHMAGKAPDFGVEWFLSTGYVSKFVCKAGRSGPAADRSEASCIGRDWYQGGDYVNGHLSDDFRGASGLCRADEMNAPIGSTYKVKFDLAAGGNKFLIMVNPNVHAGSFGTVIAKGTGQSVTTANFADKLQPGINRLAAVSQESFSHSKASGKHANVTVIPVLK